MYYWLWNTLKFKMRDTAYIYYGILQYEYILIN